jgi:myo-inositol-1(or 4)-monophosphatase
MRAMSVLKEEHWRELVDFARNLASAAGDAILPTFRTVSAVDSKITDGFDPVTEADRSGERAMRELIEKTFPAHGIQGEEFGSKQSRSEFSWILDPIDGTRSFICGMPVWTTLIALTWQGKPILGVVSQPFVREMFVGGTYGAWSENMLGRRPLSVKPAPHISQAILTTVAPELYRSPKQRNVLKAMRETTRMTRFGGDAYFFVMLAAGCVDIAMDAGLEAYDIAALVPIIEAAGGIVTTWDGGTAAAGGDIIAAASPALHAASLEIINRQEA